MTNIGVGSGFGAAGSGGAGHGESGFNLHTVSGSLGRSLQATESQMTNFMNSMDPSNMDDLMQMQMYMIQWETTVQTESSLLKGIGDTLKSVANNVGS